MTAAASAVVVVERRQVERAHDDPLVRDAEPHAVGQLVLGEHGPEGLGQCLRIGDFAVTQDAGPKRGDGPPLDEDGAVVVDLGGRDVAGVELEPDDGGGALLSLEHGPDIGSRAATA